MYDFYLRPAARRCRTANVRPSVCPSVRPSVRLSGFFDHFPEVRSSRKCSCICIFKKVTSGHNRRLTLTQGQGHRGQKHAIFGHFFELLRTPPTVFIGGCWKRIEMFLVTIRKNGMRRNFEFLPSRSDNGRPRSNLEDGLRLP